MMMTTRDLLENASLDALGLLEETERDEFERAFRAASPEVQAMIRREQVRFSDIDAWLPQVEQPVGLKAKVLDAWRSAVSAMQEAAEPVGQIGPGQAWIGRRQFTAPLWRAACIGFATATLVLGGATYWVSHVNSQISTLMAQNIQVDDLGRLGPRYREILFSPNHHERAFAPAAADVAPQAKAVLVYDAEKRTAVLVCDKLPSATGHYTLVFESDDGKSGEIKRQFDATGGVAAIPVELKVEPDGDDPLRDLGRFAIHGPTKNGGPEAVILRANDV